VFAPRTAPATLALALAALLAAPLAARAESLRCEGGIVSLGDWKLDLLGKCGQPTSREQVPVAPRVFGLKGGPPLLTTQETWSYDFGPGAFVQRVTLELGVIKTIERGPHGRDAGQPRPEPVQVVRAGCSLSGGFSIGDWTTEVLARCGEPATREETQVQVPVYRPGGSEGSVPVGTTWVRAEHWTYDFGPRANARRLEFEGGRLVRIVTGGYGYSR
jgi:hypothetical protein